MMCFAINIIKKMTSQLCSFCHEPSIIQCMNRSLYHKHATQQDKQSKIIDDLLDQDNMHAYLQFNEIVIDSDFRQYMNALSQGKSLKRQYLQLLQYYKFRFFVPLFSKSASSKQVLAYYYDKLKHYYKSIKRQLNITVQPSSTNSLSSYSDSFTASPKINVLKDIHPQSEEDKPKQKNNSMVNYKTESKALQQLVSYLKMNPQFDKVKTLKTQDCFQQQDIFQETVQKKAIYRSQLEDHPLKSQIKSKLFKKIVQGTSNSKQVPLYETQRNQLRTNQRSRSIKVIRLKQKKQIKKEDKQEKGIIFKPPQMRIKATSSTKTLPGRNTSFSKTNQNHYSSPYKKKTMSTDKNKATSTATLTLFKNAKINSSTENIKIKNYDDKKKIKDTILATQQLKFQNTVSAYRSTPISPSGRKTPRPQIKVTKTDNILTIRKKKLEALREKTSRK